MYRRHVIILGQVCNYEDKAPFSISGESIHAGLEVDLTEDKIKCHECGLWFRSVGHHIKVHGMSRRDYKRKHGLRMKTALMGPVVRSDTRACRLSNLPPTHPGSASDLDIARAIRNSQAQPPNYELANFSGKCPPQRDKKLCEIANEIGRTPSYSEMCQYGARPSSMSFRTNIVTASQKRAGLTPNAVATRWNGMTATFDKAILIEILRDFFVLNKRLPSNSDFKSKLLPAQNTFIRYFGSFKNACMEAGFTFVIDGKGEGRHRRVVESPTLDRQASL